MFESKGVQLIAQERKRHTEVEGWTPEHDAEYKQNELPLAAACYAIPSCPAIQVKADTGGYPVAPRIWPWDKEWWKPAKDNSRAERIRELQKAGALIAAEIDRLLAEVTNGKG